MTRDNFRRIYRDNWRHQYRAVWYPGAVPFGIINDVWSPIGWATVLGYCGA